MNNKTKIMNSAIVKLAILIYYFSSDLCLANLTICHNSAWKKVIIVKNLLRFVRYLHNAEFTSDWVYLSSWDINLQMQEKSQNCEYNFFMQYLLLLFYSVTKMGFQRHLNCLILYIFAKYKL